MYQLYQNSFGQYNVMKTNSDGSITSFPQHPDNSDYQQFQQWLRDNADNLPADIQAKVEAGELTIQDAD